MHIKQRIRQSCCRATLIASAAFCASIAMTPDAVAQGGGGIGVSCSQSASGCTVSVQNPGGQGTSGRDTAARPGGPTSGGPPPAVTCSDAPYTINSQNTAAMKAGQPAGPGHWVVRTCSGPVLVPTRILTWIPDGALALPDPRVLAAQALSKLTLPTPAIDSSPGGGAPQTVQLPTWAWLPEAQWAPLSATASVPGESVTATATPLAVTWSWGDGSTTVCQGPGTPYVKGVSDPAAPSPDCGHTYRQTSAQAPGQQFPVTAILTWSVAWSGGGQSGTFPNLITTAAAHWTVRQIQSLTVNP